MDLEKKERLEHEVLSYINRSRMPNPINPEDKRVWAKAVISTIKGDGSESYAIAKTIDGTRYRIIKDFGSMTPIVKHVDIRPYEYILNQYIPFVNSREDIVEFLVSFHGEDQRERISNLPSDDLKALLFAIAMEQREEDREYADKIFKERKEAMGQVVQPLDEDNPELEERKKKLSEYQQKAAQDEKRRRNTRKKAE